MYGIVDTLTRNRLRIEHLERENARLRAEHTAIVGAHEGEMDRARQDVLLAKRELDVLRGMHDRAASERDVWRTRATAGHDWEREYGTHVYRCTRCGMRAGDVTQVAIACEDYANAQKTKRRPRGEARPGDHLPRQVTP